MAKLRGFFANGRKFELVEGLAARKRDIKNQSLTLLDLEDDRVFTFFQENPKRENIRNLPLCVRIYTTPREILESMLRSAISDREIESLFDFSRKARKPSTSIRRTRTLTSMVATAKIARDYMDNYDICVTDNVLQITIKANEFKGREADEYIELVFQKMSGHFKGVIVDLSQVTYVNSTGISVLARTASEFNLRIVNPSENVKNVMNLMGLLPILGVCSTVDEALQQILEELA
jgi:anti-anti-sigma factor